MSRSKFFARTLRTYLGDFRLSRMLPFCASVITLAVGACGGGGAQNDTPAADIVAAVRITGLPNSTLPAGTTQATLSLTTSEAATCRYATAPGTTYAAMGNTFTTTGNTSHSTLVNSLLNGQTYNYYVRCQDAAGNVNGDDFVITFSVANVSGDTTPPAVAVTAPLNASTVSGTVAVSASASDNIGVVGVQFKLDGVNLGAEDTSSPYSTSWNSLQSANGSHTLTAVARDAAGNTTTSTAVTTTVNNGDTTPPSVPTGLSATVISSTEIRLNWTASTDNVGVTSYKVYRDGAEVGTSTDTSHPVTGLTPNTTYSLRVAATDLAGNLSAQSAAISATTSAAPDAVAPTVSITAPAGGTTVTGITSVTANASDNVAVVGVQFKLDGNNLGAEDTTSPYSVSWNTAGAANGTHALTAVARDAAGNSTTSAGVSVTVSNVVNPNSGLDARPSNTSCVAPARPSTGFALTNAFPSLTFAQPIFLTQPPSENGRMFVVERAGRVKVFANHTGAASATNFVDIASRVNTSGEGGLLSMAFHPNFASNRQVFLSYTRTGPSASTPLVSYISRFVSNDGGATLDAASEQVILTLNQPFDNHNGGHIAFGKDGYLYIGFGDGGGGGDPVEAGQDTSTLLGKVLRIDVNGAAPYTIPSDNPFASGSGGRAEIYAWGFRNPWRWSFDRLSGDLWLGDVGQGSWEEVDRVVKGGNYGWDCREGAHVFESAGCPTTGLIDPIAEYSHSVGNSITGGYVYRGNALPSLQGKFVYGDHGTGTIWATGSTSGTVQQLLDSSLNIASFGEGNDGELYVVDIGGGRVHKLIPSAPSATFPQKLSQTGCVVPTSPKQPAAGLIPYDINVPFWSDGATKERWLALPDAGQITMQPSHDWDFPNGSVLMKNFKLGTRWVETRLFMKHPDGQWAGYSYEWNDAETDADLVSGGKTKVIGSQTWLFPAGGQCLACHTTAAGHALGPETGQMNRSFTYPQTGRTANQVATLDFIGMFSAPLPAPVSSLPVLPPTTDTGQTLEARAKAYLHANCSNCHRPNGPTPVNMDLRFETSLAAMNICNTNVTGGDFGVTGARRLVPSQPALSMLSIRMQSLGAGRMPPLGSNVVDTQGVALVNSWIQSLAACP